MLGVRYSPVNIYSSRRGHCVISRRRRNQNWERRGERRPSCVAVAASRGATYPRSLVNYNLCKAGLVRLMATQSLSSQGISCMSLIQTPTKVYPLNSVCYIEVIPFQALVQSLQRKFFHEPVILVALVNWTNLNNQTSMGAVLGKNTINLFSTNRGLN